MSPTSSAVRGEIETLVNQLLLNELALASRPIRARESAGGAVISWVPFEGAPPRAAVPDFATLAEYRHALEFGEYSVVLFEGSLLQLSYVLQASKVVEHRLCFFPCPVLLTDEPFEDRIETLALIDALLENEVARFTVGTQFRAATGPGGSGGEEEVGETGADALADAAVTDLVADATQAEPFPRLRLRSPIRFDFDLAAQAPNHAASHLHITHEDCRLPVFGPLSVGHFARFIFRHFYPELWNRFQFLREWPLHFGTRSVTPQEGTELFIECQQTAATVARKRGTSRGPNQGRRQRR